MKKFERLRHIRYFTHSLRTLPKQYSSADVNRLSLVHFCIQSLDILGCLPGGGGGGEEEIVCGTVNEDVYINRGEIIDWIYGLSTLPTIIVDDDDDSSKDDGGDGVKRYAGGGFKGGTYLGLSDDNNNEEQQNQPSSQQQHPYDHSHIAMTYVALCTLKALNDDLSRINKHVILSTLQQLQKDDGSFMAISLTDVNGYDETKEVEAEDDCDLRFMYAAIAVWYLLTHDDDDDDDGGGGKYNYINIESATNYILSCKSYDGALGLTPGREGHGGSTFCGIASLHLMGVLDTVMSRQDLVGWKDTLIYWCVMRQRALNNDDLLTEEYPCGMQGRPNKLEDTCYSYWIGGTLHLLDSSHLIDGWALREYVLKCQSPYGGFGKVVGCNPDLLHSFYSMAWLTLSKEGGCCDDDDNGGEGNDDSGEHVMQQQHESEVTTQVRESIDTLSKFDCALGMCSKRT
jgi:geranylgeranyl transferase type-1 subunit beta